MKKENVYEIKNTIFQQILKFESLLFDRKVEVNDKVRELAKNISDMVDVLLKDEIDDFDLWVFLKYREGKRLSKKSCIKKFEPKTLLNAIEEGFELSDDATMVEIEIKPVLNRDYDRHVASQSIYSLKFGLGNGEELTLDQLKRRYGLDPDENLFSVDDMKESRILKFYNKKKRIKEMKQQQAQGL